MKFASLATTLRLCLSTLCLSALCLSALCLPALCLSALPAAAERGACVTDANEPEHALRPAQSPAAAVFFPVSQVRLLDGPFKRRHDTNASYLLDHIAPDRLLAPFREHAGLAPREKRYGGWEAGGYGGCSLGHYLTALSFLHASSGDSGVREKALRRIDYIIAELAACHRARGDGALWPGTTAAAGSRLPFYGIHKLLAGLRDARRLAGNKDALAIERAIADWIDSLPLEKIHAKIASEYGGINEVLADLAADTGDARYLRMAAWFHRDSDSLPKAKNRFRVMDFAPLYRGEDRLGVLHANTHIPIVTGLAREYELTGDPRYRAAATSFWSHVVHDRSYVIGGHSESEHFFPPALFPKKLTPRTCETCNTNNMLKLTGHLFEWEPDAAQMDFAERALINHILAGIGENPGEFSYFFSLAPVALKVFSTPFDSWWCCVGTGMENPSKYGAQIYARDTAPPQSPPSKIQSLPALWLNHYIASALDWPEAGLRLAQKTQFPDSDTVRVEITTADSKPRHFTLKLRHPAWCPALEIKINGQPVNDPSAPSSYLALTRDWHDGDTIELRLPMTLRAEPLPHSDNKIIALLFGPSVLAAVIPGDSGSPPAAPARFSNFLSARGKTDAPVPLIVTQNAAAIPARPSAAARFGDFDSNGLFRPDDDKSGYAKLALVPLHRIHGEQYAVYFPVLTPGEWTARETQIRAGAQSRQKLDNATLDTVTPGNNRSESAHAFHAQKSRAGKAHGREYREARENGGWFSYEMAVSPDAPVTLIATCGWGGIQDERRFDIFIDDHLLAATRFSSDSPGDYKDTAHPIPPEWTHGKTKVTVRFTARPATAELFALRTVLSAAAPPAPRAGMDTGFQITKVD